MWEALFERPIGEAIEAAFADDVLRGIVLTDALIGTFAGAHDPDLRQNRCFLYHVIGNGTGDWDVPVGGMGAVTAALADAAETAGAELRCGVEVTEVVTDGMSAEVRWDGGRAACGHVLSNVAPTLLARLLGEPAPERAPEGAQLKVNMLLARLPRLRDGAVDPRQAFAGTLHVNEAAGQLAEGKLLYEVVLNSDKVQFPFEKAELTEGSKEALDSFAQQLKADNKNVFIEVQGHTDSSGDETANLSLGERRAESVRRYLNREHGIPLHRMSVISYGETAPLTDNDTKEHRAENRRVSLVVLM